MIILPPDPATNLAEQVRESCRWRPSIVVPVRGAVLAGEAPEGAPEPFRTVDRIMAGVWNVVLTDGWLPGGTGPDAWEVWEAECQHFAGEFGLGRRLWHRAVTQSLHDGVLQVLFLERERLLGAADIPAAPAGQAGFDVSAAVLALVTAARDAGLTSFEDVVGRTRVALATPGRPPIVRPEPVRAPTRAGAPAAAPPPAPAPATAAEPRHSVESGRCTTCGKSGAALQEPCGRPELGRMGMIELD